MSDGSTIEWLGPDGATWNPLVGCSPISKGCDNCFASRMAARFGPYQLVSGRNFNGKILEKPEKLNVPLHWKKPRKIFVNSMGDLFHQAVPWEFIYKVLARIWVADWHTYLILTKRPAIMAEFFNAPQTRAKVAVAANSMGELGPDAKDWPLKNLWVGITAENEQAMMVRQPLLIRTESAHRFISIEPMLGPIHLDSSPPKDHPEPDGCWGFKCGRYLDGIDWIICGGETGRGARPMQKEWAEELTFDCASSNIPFFFKKAGTAYRGEPYMLPQQYPDEWNL